MAEINANKTRHRMTIRHRGRGAQVWIYLGKMLRMFVYQNDWKVLPMAALIAGLVGMVIRRKFFINMEGTVMGAFAMVCVCIWNGCFNSIQVICRERDVIKREHRSGMHISSYIVAHMIYQALLCLLQVGVTLFVTRQVGVKYPVEGRVTSLFIVEFGISMFLITYAFQLVFSGGMLTLPKWSKPLTYLTVSNPGLKVIAAQADVNHQPYATIADMVKKMKDEKIDATITVGQIMDMLDQKDNGTVSAIRGQVVVPTMTLGQLKQALDSSATVKAHRDDALAEGLTLGDALDLIDRAGLWAKNSEEVVTSQMTVGDIIDLLAQNPDFQSQRDRQIGMPATVGDILDLVGEDRAMKFLEEKAAAANYKPEYEYTADNVYSYWLTLFIFILAFAALATITLEFIDRDKR